MFVLAKSLEAVGILCVFVGLILGVNSPTLWIELYLLIIGSAIFLVGWGIEKVHARRTSRTASQK
jgi:hypothetical protein